MKINRLDAHDRFEYFKKQEFDIGQTCQNMINQRPFGDHAFYIFAHKRQIGLDERVAMFNEDLRMSLSDMTYQRRFQNLADVPTDRLIWQPRLTKPKAQDNSMLFKAYPGSDTVKVLWMIPAKEMWEQYEKGLMLENKTVVESIYDFKNNPRKLESPEDDDLSDEQINAIYLEIKRSSSKQPILGAFSSSPGLPQLDQIHPSSSLS